jgi:hypothetical protein
MFSPSIKLISSFTQNPNHTFKFTPKTPLIQSQKPIIQCARKGSSSKRTGKSRYPSEKRKLKSVQVVEMNEDEKFKGFWRFFKLGVLVENDPGKDFVDLLTTAESAISRIMLSADSQH